LNVLGWQNKQNVNRLDVKPVALHARVGIATGLVVVGDLIGEGSAQEQTVVGETPNLAARLQAVAGPDAVVIAASTRRLTGELFEYGDLGEIELKGIAAPVTAWQVLRPSAVASRFEALRGSALTPLVGRDEEIDLLLRRWARAKAGDGQIVLISGEPGIGKSRITAELEGSLHAEPHLRLRYFCSSYCRDSALYPFIDQLWHAAEFARVDPPAAKLEKLEGVLARAAPPDEDVALLADLMSLPALERHQLPNLSPQRKKERTLEALIRQLEGLARRQPVVVVFEDAHWIDPTSRELLELTVERVRSLPVLLIVTFRPDFQPPWVGQPQVTMLALNRLDRRDRTALVEQICGGIVLPDEVVGQIADRTDGVPLFVEELTKSVVESGPTLIGMIPTTLHDSLMARLDRLGSVRHMAQIGAAIGREFPYALLRAISSLPEDELRTALGRLVASELVFQRGMPPDAVYSFKHALVQDVAHGSLLRNARQQLHAQIANALETQSPEIIESQPELLAQHYAEAGLVEKAVAFWGKAGHRSVARSAMAEAAAQFQKGLDQLALLPDIPERRREELEFSSALGAVLNVVKGSAAPETGQAYARARELWEQLGSPAEFIQVPCGQSRYHAHRGELERAQSLAEMTAAAPRPANSQVSRARCIGLQRTSENDSLASTGRMRSASRRLLSVKGMSVVPCADRSSSTRSPRVGSRIHSCLPSGSRCYLLLSNALPPPASQPAAPTSARDLGHVVTIAGNVLLVVNEFVPDRLLGVGRRVARLGTRLIMSLKGLSPHHLLTGRTTTGFSRLSWISSVSWRITRRSPSRSVYSTLSKLISTSNIWPRYVTGNRSMALSWGARRGQKDNVPLWSRIPPSP
jgi:hypothetical protein